MSEIPHPISLSFDKSEPLSVDYLSSLDIGIGVRNEQSEATMVIESLALRFQSRRQGADGTKADPHATVVYTGDILAIPPKKLTYCTVKVRPSLLFLANSNLFDVAITYRLDAEKTGDRREFAGDGWYIVVRPAPQLFGKVFVSYKEPEDRRLADRIFQFAKDAGFNPYMAPPHLRPGSRIWREKIPPAIKESRCMFVIWTRNSAKGTGVKREIKIARSSKIDIVPLLDRGTTDPKLFGAGVEYTQFDADDADVAFADFVAARRDMG